MEGRIIGSRYFVPFFNSVCYNPLVYLLILMCMLGGVIDTSIESYNEHAGMTFHMHNCTCGTVLFGALP